jgi:hypothetical protein
MDFLHWDPIGNKIRSVQAENAKAKIQAENKKKIIYAYWDLRDILGSYKAVKSEFDIRGLPFPPESYLYPDVNMAGGGASIPSFISGLPEVTTFVPSGTATPPLLDVNQQVELIRNLSRITYEISGNGTVVSPHTPRIDTPTPIARPARQARQTGVITEGDYAGYRPPSTSSSSSSSSSSRPDNIIVPILNPTLGRPNIDSDIDISKESKEESKEDAYKRIVNRQIADVRNIFKDSKMPEQTRQFLDKQEDKQDEKQEEKQAPVRRFAQPTQTLVGISTTIKRVVKSLFTAKSGLIRRVGIDITPLQAILEKIWGHRTRLQERVLGLFNSYGIEIYKTQRKVDETQIVKSIINRIMKLDPQLLNNLIIELIRILDQEPEIQGKIKPVTTDSSSLAVAGADLIFDTANLDDPSIRTNFINTIIANRISGSAVVAGEWFDDLLNRIKLLSHERFKNTGDYNESRILAKKLLYDNINQAINDLLNNTKDTFYIDTEKVKKLIKIFMGALGEPVSIGAREVVNHIRHRRVIAELATLDDSVLTPATVEEFAEANRLRREGFGNQFYDVNTVVRFGDFEIKEIPMGDLPDPPDPDDPDPNRQNQLYIFRWLRHQVTSNIRVIALIITLITTSVGAAIKIIQAIKREHSPDEANTEDTKTTDTSKDTPKDTSKTTDTPIDTPTDRPKRTKRH